MTARVERCPLCAETAHVAADRVRGYQSGRYFTILECEGCRASFAMPLAVDDALYERIYENARYVPGYNRYVQYATEVLRQRHPLRYLSRQEEAYWAVAQFLHTAGRPGRSLRILEVGCGMGYFTYALAQAGYDVAGVDLSPEAIAWATARFGTYYSTRSLDELAREGRRYDVIVMNQLIEHIPEIHPFLAGAVALLEPHGSLVITTPNKTAYPGGAWRTELPPVHLWWLGEEAMRTIAQRHGCTVSFIDFTAYHRLTVRPASSELEATDRPQVIDERGQLVTREEVPAPGRVKHALERVGLWHLLRIARALVPGGHRWRGPRGEVMAAVLRRATTKDPGRA